MREYFCFLALPNLEARNRRTQLASFATAESQKHRIAFRLQRRVLHLVEVRFGTVVGVHQWDEALKPNGTLVAQHVSSQIELLSSNAKIEEI